jgi:Raf kinase inhibitor-like YbhB/YbcL family protein
MSARKLRLRSPAFREGQIIPRKHTCEGEDVSPHLAWDHPPEGTQGFVVVVTDPDAPNGTFTHWVLYHLPADTQELPEGASGKGTAGRNDFQALGWGGPCPPPGHGDHRYVFTLSALDSALDLGPHARREEVERAMEGHVIQSAQLTGRYARDNA